MESHAHDILRIKNQACNVTSKYNETFQIKKLSFLWNDWLTSSFFTSFSPLFLPFFLLFLSRQFQTFPLLPKSVASIPHFAPPSFPSPLFSLIFRCSQQTHPRAQPGGGATACCSCTLRSCQSSHFIQSDESKLCQSRYTSEYEPWRWGMCGKKKWERESVPAMDVCFGTRPTHYALFLNPTVDSIFWTNRLYFKASIYLYAQLHRFWLKKYEIVEFIMG